ncbi:MAG: hypothetical protein ABSE95_18780 [Thermodesulfobacteriota bacterium]|jgi:hypothetical protein
MIEPVLVGKVDESFLLEVQKWAGEVIGKIEPGTVPDRISVYLWEKEKDFQEFDAREKIELGVVTGDESNFLATHEAWRGYPRIHISLEKIRGIPEEVIQGVVQHEIGHALLHGKPEFYQFLFSEHLQETARSAGLYLPQLQQLVYLLSVALKDEEVVRLLMEWGLGIYQNRVLEYLIEDTGEEQQTWELIKDLPALRKLAWAAFLKTLLPIETLAGLGDPKYSPLIDRWEKAYSWLTNRERTDLRAYARWVIELPSKHFQDRLEQAVLGLIRNASL